MVVASKSVSWAECDVLNYFETLLKPAAPGRDWRIFLVDCYAAHRTEAVRRLVWKRLYVSRVYGGGVAGILQVNDTDFHQPLKQLYEDLETAEILQQSRMRPQACQPQASQSVFNGWPQSVDGRGCTPRLWVVS